MRAGKLDTTITIRGVRAGADGADRADKCAYCAECTYREVGECEKCHFMLSLIELDVALLRVPY